jgi:predicted enzyme related to lactoylglutathione lyase
MIKIQLVSVYVSDQEKAHKFYTEVLGFTTAMDIPMGEARFLTVVSPKDAKGTQLLLEPNGNPVSKTYQEGIYNLGLPCIVLGVDDIQKEYERMTALGVVFTQPPTPMGPVTAAMLEDTCGNLIQIAQSA